MFTVWVLVKLKHEYVAPVLQDEFSVQPSDEEVAEGEVAVLNCGPPIGRPDPNVFWKKDGMSINYSDPHYTVSPCQKKNKTSQVHVIMPSKAWYFRHLHNETASTQG